MEVEGQETDYVSEMEDPDSDNSEPETEEESQEARMMIVRITMQQCMVTDPDPGLHVIDPDVAMNQRKVMFLDRQRRKLTLLCPWRMI